MSLKFHSKVRLDYSLNMRAGEISKSKFTLRQKQFVFFLLDILLHTSQGNFKSINHFGTKLFNFST